jgi:methyl-accepting chemotaxis protein
MNLSIRQKLTGGVVLLVVSISLTISLVAYLQAYNAVETQLQENAPQVAGYGARLIHSQIRQYKLALEGIANRHVIRSMEWEAKQ